MPGVTVQTSGKRWLRIAPLSVWSRITKKAEFLSYRITLYCTVWYCVVENNKGKIGFFELKRSLSPSLSFQPLNQLVVLFQTGHNENDLGV